MTPTPPQALPGAKDVRAKAADWLQRSHFWTWSAEDQVALDAWLAQSPAHMTAYLRVRASWENAGRLTALRGTSHVPYFSAVRRRLFPMLIGAAAVAAIVIVVASNFMATLFAPREKVYATGIGGFETVKLADGSQIELNTDTKLRLTVSAHVREVWLDRGEAYFQIKHDVARPFVVLAGNDRIHDLGTKFMMRREPRRLEVAVLEGRVQLESKDANKPQSISLARGDDVVSSNGAMPLKRQPISEMMKELSWRAGVLIFENTTLADAAMEFNRYNTEKVVVMGGDVERLTIGGKFAKNDTAAFIELAQRVLALHVEDRGGVTVISR